MADPRFPQDVLERVGRWRGRTHPFERLEPKRTALLVVDMQNFFLSPESNVSKARQIVPNINRLADALRAAGGHVVWVISTYGPDPKDRWSVLFDHVFSPEHGAAFRAGLTRGADSHGIWPELRRQAGEAVIEKNRFGGFSGSGGRLERELRTKGVDSVLITGTVTNVCCETTAREASMLDFKTVMITDGNAGRTEEADWRTFGLFLQIFGDALSTDQAIGALRG
ncbi:MAG: cysteine hydrolase [Alphaproteobacteria bacterium]|nr:cysteine hydrolase [Alphaproteobacteria bacterium]